MWFFLFSGNFGVTDGEIEGTDNGARAALTAFKQKWCFAGTVPKLAFAPFLPGNGVDVTSPGHLLCPVIQTSGFFRLKFLVSPRTKPATDI